jgi:hypothetical protein
MIERNNKDTENKHEMLIDDPEYRRSMFNRCEKDSKGLPLVRLLSHKYGKSFRYSPDNFAAEVLFSILSKSKHLHLSQKDLTNLMMFGITFQIRPAYKASFNTEHKEKLRAILADARERKRLKRIEQQSYINKAESIEDLL